ncbi:SNARE associated golgi family protein [Nitzschia inconspicua]|uniref:SNARE associated golgi family protein n=1 Tax=Nitzschia inconspicua TaxID=303405 RepID=A0A9K3PB54_9STRA|nr:SNARE associated golgi family protein [Nitzschia inconspicua]
MLFSNRRKTSVSPTPSGGNTVDDNDNNSNDMIVSSYPSGEETSSTMRFRTGADTETSINSNNNNNNNNIFHHQIGSSHSHNTATADDNSETASGVSDTRVTMITPTTASTTMTNTKSTTRSNKRKKSFSKQSVLSVVTTTNGLLSRVSQKIFHPKKLILLVIVWIFAVIIWDSFFVDPKDRLLQPDFSDQFLDWVEGHPLLGMGAILIVIAGAVVSMVPIGTPLTLGCGYIYRGVYGWKLGLFVSTVVSMAGSTLGAVCCFLLGRYLMRDTVKRWVRNYPLFDAIDVAASQHGLKIMAMLYLTPVLPLGLVSYACGTTTMDVSAFALAKIASLPLYLLYTFIGASAHSFIQRGAATDGGSGGGGGGGGIGKSVSAEAKKLEENQFLLIAGLVLSVVMMTLITRHIRKELMKILDQQKKEKVGADNAPLLDVDADDVDEKTMEMGLTSRSRRKTNSNKGGAKET